MSHPQPNSDKEMNHGFQPQMHQFTKAPLDWRVVWNPCWSRGCVSNTAWCSLGPNAGPAQCSCHFLDVAQVILGNNCTRQLPAIHVPIVLPILYIMGICVYSATLWFDLYEYIYIYTCFLYTGPPILPRFLNLAKPHVFWHLVLCIHALPENSNP